MGNDNVNKMDVFGVTEKEKEMNVQSYNHALFRNMVFFMDIVWEINMLTGTMAILRDKGEPDDDVVGMLYEDVYQSYMENRIMEGERALFRQYMDMDNLKELESEITFDVKLKSKNQEWELHRIVLTPAFDKDGRLYCVYFGARNLQAEVTRELAEYHNQRQFRDALITNSYFHVDFDLDGDNMLHEDYVTRDNIHLIRYITGMDLPVNFDLFIRKWYEMHEPRFDKLHGKDILQADYLRKAYERNERLINMEIKQKVCGGDGMPEYLQVFIILMEDIEEKHVHANIIWRDVSAFHKKAVEDNRVLQNSNRILQRTISQEQQFRQSVLSGAILFYNINLTRNLIEEEFYETVDGKQFPMLELMGLDAPCSFDEFRQRWSEQKISEDSRENFLKIYNRDYMLEAYERGERRLELEFDTSLARGIRITLRNTALLVEDEESGDIIAMVNAKDVTEQKQEEFRQREALREAYEEANRANNAKTEFVARLSHDIRTPLNAIIGMTTIAGKHRDNEERVVECLKKISLSGKYLLALVDEMLDMSMIESGKMVLQEEEINLEEQFENLSILLQMQVKDSGHRLNTFRGTLEHGRAMGDRRRIDQVIMNLVDNAAKYTMESGVVSVSLNERESDRPEFGCYELVVEDHGIGIKPEFMDQIFEPFVRAKDRRVEKVQGSGLGLAITKNIVQMMDGTIDIESEPEKGTKVTVRVSLRLPQENTDEAETPEGAASGEEEKLPIESLAERDFSGHRVLVVEDNEPNADIIKEILQMSGLEVEHVWNGKEAVDRMSAVEDGYYDLVFMDIRMPVMDGYEASKAIRSLESGYAKTVPIIAMSANAYPEDIQASLSSGMNEHVAKPIDLKRLENVLCEWITGQGK